MRWEPWTSMCIMVLGIAISGLGVARLTAAQTQQDKGQYRMQTQDCDHDRQVVNRGDEDRNRIGDRDRDNQVQGERDQDRGRNREQDNYERGECDDRGVGGPNGLNRNPAYQYGFH